MTKTIDCRFCNGTRDANDSMCLGCGSPIANARRTVKVRKAEKPCPECNSRNSSVIDDHRFMCRDCGGTFENEDFGFVDDRPEINAMKRGL